MSTSTRPPYEIKVAKTKDEIEACYDIRIEGKGPVWHSADLAVFAVEQVSVLLGILPSLTLMCVGLPTRD